MIKNLKEKFATNEYGYIVIPHKEICMELQDREKAYIYAKTFNAIFYDHFPYKEYGFEDPYTLCNTWCVMDQDGNRITYIVIEDKVKEE